ncbi:ABC transporter ATP-binding protein [Roseibacterium sp. SDUM158017]|uniref:ABC transporter ATP-binding protein n=1 Tax=Roseicyclus salinarum TaxID=3036773 RepID=UPI002415439E|nr:ABC transporter ATP-binding protein [Roseibacterium sp. SDUM158017]MDG4647139.1 ABC transporter ATP-binding protein [Roseibacterium sp. SDUM158017]
MTEAISLNSKPDTSGREAAAVARRLLREALPSRWKLFALSLVCMLGVAGFTAALAYSTRLIVNDVFVASDASAAIGIAFLVIGVAFGKSIFDYTNSVIAVMFNRSVSSHYQKLVFRKTVTNDVWHFAGLHPATQMTQVRMFGEACGKTVIGISNRLLTDSLTVLALVVVMIVQDPLMSLATAILFPLIFLLVGTLSRKIRAVANAETELTGAFFSIGSEAFQGIKTVKSYQLEDKSIRRFNDAVNMLQERLLGFAKITAATVPIMEALGGVVIGLFVIYAAWQTITQGQTPGEFTAFITAFLMAYQPAERVSKTWVELQKSLVHVGRMYRLLDTPLRQRDTGTRTLDDADPEVEFEHVSFDYTADAPALKDVCFNIASGERVAIVGRSGAGKSTLIDLVLRFYDPTEGRVLIGGVDLRDVTEKSLRQSIAFISQDVFLFDGTIRDNIRDGNPDATDAAIEEAARRAQLDSVVAALPDGLDSRVGPNGSNLSGGQKQRVGIARALAKNANIYIFDEATSALDVQNERLIMETVVNELDGATILFVTHRPSTLNYVDRVLMLDAGQVVAFDRHERLERENERYQTLFNLAMKDDEKAAEEDAEVDPEWKAASGD